MCHIIIIQYAMWCNMFARTALISSDFTSFMLIKLLEIISATNSWVYKLKTKSIILILMGKNQKCIKKNQRQ